MKFLCMGYYDATSMEGKTEAEMAAFMEECFTYDDELRRCGHFTGGEALQPAEHAVTLRNRGGQVESTDGPFAETKEQIGGILILEARDMNQAVELMSKHPGVRFGPFEIRPADEQINALIQARDEAMR